MPFRSSRTLLHLVLAVTAICVFVPLLPTLARDGLDESWMLGMNSGLASGLIPGRDIVFTLGPYAAIYTRNYHPATDAGMIWGSVFLALSVAFMLRQLFTQARWPQVFLALIVLTGVAYSRDALLLFIPLLTGAYTYHLIRVNARGSLRSPSILTALAISYAPFGLLVLVKGSMLVACVITQSLGTALFLARRQAYPALTILLTPLLSTVLCWHLAGLPITALPDYFATLAPIISGYTEAMSSTGPLLEVWCYILIASALTAYLAIRERENGLAAAYLVLVFAAAAFLAFKGGYVRHDGHVGHALLAACHLVLAALVVHLLRASRTTLTLVLASSLIWLGSSVYHAIPNPSFALIPPTFVMADRLRLQEHIDAGAWFSAAQLTLKAGTHHLVRSIRATYADAAHGLATRLGDGPSLADLHAERMKKIAAHTGLPKLPGSTDIYSFRQALLIASGNQWNPRPVFQSYTVYTPTLAELNRRHLAGEQGADNILLRLEPIDDRLPALEDGLSWPTLLTHYAPTGFENGYLLLKRLRNAEALQTPPPLKQRQRLGRRIELPKDQSPLFAQISIKPTITGQILGLLYKLPPLHITLELRNGSTREYRFVAGMAQAGFLLSPFIGSAADFARLYDSSRQPTGLGVRAMRLDGDPSVWRETFDIELTPLALPASLSSSPQLPGLVTPQPTDLQTQAAEHCDGNLDRLNGTRSHAAQIVDGLLDASGWLARSAPHGRPAHNIQLVLTDSSGAHLTLPARPDPRPDIATYFSRPQLTESGYTIAADLRSLRGNYTLRVAHEHDGAIQICPTPVIPLTLVETLPSPPRAESLSIH